MTSDADRIAAEERRYREIEPYVPEKDRVNVEALRDEREAGNKYNAYGHDLFGAVRRGWRRKAREHVAKAADCMVEAGWRDAPRLRFSALLYVLIEQAGTEGATEDEVRRTLQRMLDAEDASRIEKLLERAGKSA